jgi:hypothetical protein
MSFDRGGGQTSRECAKAPQTMLVSASTRTHIVEGILMCFANAPGF